MLSRRVRRVHPPPDRLTPGTTLLIGGRRYTVQSVGQAYASGRVLASAVDVAGEPVLLVWEPSWWRWTLSDEWPGRKAIG